MDTRTRSGASSGRETFSQDILNGSLNRRRCAGQGRVRDLPSGSHASYGTILEIGISKMSVAPDALSSGISVLTLDFSTTVSIAKFPSSASGETVGAFIEGNTSSNLSRASPVTLSLIR